MARLVGDAVLSGVIASATDQAVAAMSREFRNMMNNDFVTVRMWYEPRLLSGAARRTTSAATSALRKMAKEMNSKLVMRTPIDTGLARSSWIGSIGEPNTAFLPKKKPYPRGGAPASYGRNAIIRNNRIIEGLNNGDKFFMTNNQKYVAYLEYGRSSQAPAGFIRITMIEMKDKYPAAFRQAFEGSTNLLGAAEVGGETADISIVDF